MRWAGVALAALTLGGASCSPAHSAPAAASPAPSTPSPAGDAVFAPYVGAYRTDGGQTLVINGHGHLLNLQDMSFRRLYPATESDHLTFGPGFSVPEPKQADVRFHVTAGRADQLIETPVGGQPVRAVRLAFRESEVRIPAQGAVLAGTVTEPLGPGPHPGIVIIHGSGPGPRIDYGIWVGAYASLGLTVLAYDKRGNGSSTGTYPGEFASADNLAIYADDAAAVAGFLAGWPGVDARRVGFHGGSQGAWTTPLAIQRHPAAAFAVLVSGPAVTVGQQGVWADFSGGSNRTPSETEADMNAAVRADHSGFDPGPALKAADQPMIWLNGAADHQVPTTVNTEVLRGFGKPQWEVVIMPGVDHGLFVNPGGLWKGEDAATMLAPGFFDHLEGWLAKHLA